MDTNRLSILALLTIGMGSVALAYDPGADDIVAVTGRTSPDYVRVRQKDGTYLPENYSFGKGGDWSGTMKDDSIDKLTFLDVAHMIAYPLAEQHYFPASDPAKTKLLIMVYWGTTHTPDQEAVTANENLQALYDEARLLTGPEAEELRSAAIAQQEAANRMRDNENTRNAMLLGYESWWDKTINAQPGTPLYGQRGDLIKELEDDRYFVVLMAYDFQVLRKEKKHRLLWETRFSIRQQHHLFDKELPSLAQYASRYFGQDSGGLVRDKVPLGKVDIGEVKSLGEATPPK